MARKKIMMSIYLDTNQDQDLRALRQKTGTPVAVMIRDAIDHYLQDRAHEIPAPTPDPRQVPIDFVKPAENEPIHSLEQSVKDFIGGDTA